MTSSTKPYLIIGIILLMIPLFIFIFYGNIYETFNICETSMTAECMKIRTFIVLIPVSLGIGFVFFIYASIKRMKK